MIIAIRDVTFTEHLIIQNGILLLFKGKYTKCGWGSQLWFCDQINQRLFGGLNTGGASIHKKSCNSTQNRYFFKDKSCNHPYPLPVKEKGDISVAQSMMAPLLAGSCSFFIP